MIKRQKKPSLQKEATSFAFHVDTFRGQADISIRMVGKFNVYNAMAAIAAALLEGVPLEDIKNSLESVPGA